MNETTSNIHTQTAVTRTFWNSATGRIDYAFEFVFRNREQYLAFRRLWKENYATLSHSIRSLKELIKATMRKREYAGSHQSKVHELKAEATRQLLMLHAAKQEANRQYQSAKWKPPIA